MMPDWPPSRPVGGSGRPGPVSRVFAAPCPPACPGFHASGSTVRANPFTARTPNRSVSVVTGGSRMARALSSERQMWPGYASHAATLAMCR
jgi:hypothetical protein